MARRSPFSPEDLVTDEAYAPVAARSTAEVIRHGLHRGLPHPGSRQRRRGPAAALYPITDADFKVDLVAR